MDIEPLLTLLANVDPKDILSILGGVVTVFTVALAFIAPRTETKKDDKLLAFVKRFAIDFTKSKK